MISIIKSEIVDKRKWLTSDELMELTVVAEATPGPIAINAATFVGFKIGKFFGALCATIGVIIPSLIIISVISYFFNRFISNVYVGYAFMGIKIAVAYLILDAGLRLFKGLEKKPFTLILFFIAFFLLCVFEIFEKSISSILFILISGVIGIFYTLIKKLKENKREDEIK